MKKMILFAAVLAGLATGVRAAGTNVFSSEGARTSYALGMYIGGQLKQGEYDLDTDMYMRGLKDGLAGGATLLSQPEFQETMRQFSTMMQSKRKEMMVKMAAKTEEEGKAFLATNKNSPGVVVLPSGLQYKILKAGDGPKPKATDTVLVNYRGTLLNGVEFDSSAKAGKPVPLSLGGVIKGWTEALQLMGVGSKWQLYIPADLAYGSRGRQGAIPPNSTLIFDIELVGIEPPKPPGPPMQHPMPPHTPPTPSAPLTSDIIKVPSKAEMDKGAQIEYIKQEDLLKMQATNKPASTNTP